MAVLVADLTPHLVNFQLAVLQQKGGLLQAQPGQILDKRLALFQLEHPAEMG
ncbi:hypothetical protein D3C76_1851190 [compost metagenome]